MTWWGSAMSGDSFSPKQKSRFIVEMGNGGNLVSVKSVTKPTATVESKQYRMINHYYNYPGLVKWEPITITFIDTKHFGSTETHQNRMTSHQLWEMLLASGYTTPSGEGGGSTRAKSISSPEKASTIHHSFGNILYIHQLHPDGTGLTRDEKGKVIKNDGFIKSVETWEIMNPIITKISWGELDYGDDSLIEYKLDIAYDFAVHHEKNPNEQESN